MWGKQAENCDRYLFKGKQVAVNGRIQTGSYKDKDGKTVYTTDVIANNVEFLGGKTEAEPKHEAFDLSDMPSSFSYAEDGMPF